VLFVSKKPGAIATTLIPNIASSLERVTEKDSIADFDEEYAD